MDARDDLADWDPETALDEVLDLLADVGPADARMMAAAWAEIDPAERTAAWAVVRSESKGGRERILDEARAAVLRWADETNHSLEGSPYSVTFGSDLDKQAARVLAAAPVLDAAAASILRDRLPPETFEILYSPFALAIAPSEDDTAIEETVDFDVDDEDDEPTGAEDDAPDR